MDVFGIRLVGVSGENGRKLLMSLALIAALLILRWLLAALNRWLIGHTQRLARPSGFARSSTSRW